LDETEVEFLEPFPDAAFWVNDFFRLEHGSKHSSTLGRTAAAHLADGNPYSRGYGHLHRRELLERTIMVGRKPRLQFAGSPGTLARTDGVVPSAKTGVTSLGTQAGQLVENWQQGLWLFWYEEKGDYRVFLDNVSIQDGTALWQGRLYVASV
jgi:hypothetical protein